MVLGLLEILPRFGNQSSTLLICLSEVPTASGHSLSHAEAAGRGPQASGAGVSSRVADVAASYIYDTLQAPRPPEHGSAIPLQALELLR